MADEPVLYYSTNRTVAKADLRTALLQGQAADRGLFMPERVPPLDSADFVKLAAMSYPEIAHFILRRFTVGALQDEQLRALCNDAYDYDVPLEQVAGRRWLLRLDRGPTASRSRRPHDGPLMGAFMADVRGELLSSPPRRRHGQRRSPRLPRRRVQSVVLFPVAEVSARQRRQMTTLGGNVTTFAVDGKFDDCQAMVKRAFSDPDLAGIRLSSANSINIGRLLPQSVYYVYAYVRLADARAREPIVFSVPSGNFGDMMGAVLAARMGVPISRIVIATNANDEVPRFFASGHYEKIAPSRVCISNAMNVGHPSNLARLVDAYGGWMDETGVMREPPDMAALRRDFHVVSISDEETRATIRETWGQHRVPRAARRGRLGGAEALSRRARGADRPARRLGGDGASREIPGRDPGIARH
jgi:threonine synthase